MVQSEARLTKEPDIPDSISVRPHTFVFLPLIHEGTCQLPAKV